MNNWQKSISDNYLIQFFKAYPELFDNVKEFQWRLVESASLVLVKYFVQNFPEIELQKQINHALLSGNLDVVEYFLAFNFEKEELPDCRVIKTAIGNGHIKAVELILSNRKHGKKNALIIY